MTKVNATHLFIYLRARKKAETRAKNRKEAAVVMQADKGRRQGRGGTEKTARPNLAARTQAREMKEQSWGMRLNTRGRKGRRGGDF